MKVKKESLRLVVWLKNKSITLHKLKNYYLVNGARLTDYKKQKKKRQSRKLLRNFNNVEICNKNA